MASIELIGLTRHYNQGSHVVRALHGIDLHVDGGEFISVVGRSGSGKTTMLDLMGLLLRPTSGTVLIDGVDTARLSEGRRADLRAQRIGFVFQQYNLLPSLTVMDNVLLPIRYSRSAGPEGRQRALRLLEYVGLTDRVTHRPDELSGGNSSAWRSPGRWSTGQPWSWRTSPPARWTPRLAASWCR